MIENYKYESNDEKEKENDADLENDQRYVRSDVIVKNNDKSDKVKILQLELIKDKHVIEEMHEDMKKLEWKCNKVQRKLKSMEK